MTKKMILIIMTLIVVSIGCNFAMNDGYDKEIADSGAVFTVSGKFTDKSANPVVGLVVLLKGDTERSATTDAQGNYTFTDVSPGGYAITPGDSGYGQKNINVINTDLNLGTNDDGHGGNTMGDYTCSVCH